MYVGGEKIQPGKVSIKESNLKQLGQVCLVSGAAPVILLVVAITALQSSLAIIALQSSVAITALQSNPRH